MSLNWGTPANPESWLIGWLMPLGLPIGAEREELTGLPGYVVTSVAPTDDKLTLEAIVSLHTFAQNGAGGGGRAQASQAAWNAHNRILSCTPGDVVTLPGGGTVDGAWTSTKLAPTFANYQDPLIARYVARYCIELRFTIST